jgi:hypothetical protein
MAFREEDVFEEGQKREWTDAVYAEMGAQWRRKKGRELFGSQLKARRRALEGRANMNATEIAYGAQGRAVIWVDDLLLLVSSVSSREGVRYRIAEFRGDADPVLRRAVNKARSISFKHLESPTPPDLSGLDSAEAEETYRIGQLIREGVKTARRAVR